MQGEVADAQEKRGKRREAKKPREAEVAGLQEKQPFEKKVERFVSRYLFQVRERFGFWPESDARRTMVDEIRKRLYRELKIPHGKLIGTEGTEINAFVVKTMPDVFITSGILRSLTAWCNRHGKPMTHDKVAFLVGHELSHIEQGTEEETGEDRETSSRSEQEQKSKNHEYDADRRALVVMAQAGYNPREGLEVIEFLRSLGETPPIFSTHPRSGDRLRELIELVESPDTFLPGTSKKPEELDMKELEAIKNEGEHHPGTRLYQREGLEHIDAFMDRTDNLYDAIEVMMVARAHERAALAQAEHEKPYMKKRRAERIVLHNISEVLQARVDNSKSGRMYYYGLRDHAAPTPEARYRDAEFSYESLGPLVDDDVNFFESDMRDVEEIVADQIEYIKKLVDKLEGEQGLINEHSAFVPKQEVLLGRVDSGEIKEKTRETDYKTYAELEATRQETIAAIANLKALAQDLKIAMQEIPRVIARVSDLSLDALARDAMVTGSETKSWNETMDARAFVAGRGMKELLEWCETNGTPYFVYHAYSLARKYEQRSGGAVSFASSYEPVLPESHRAKEDITTPKGRQLWNKRATWREVYEFAETYLDRSLSIQGDRLVDGKALEPVLAQPRRAPLTERLMPKMRDKFQARYEQALDAEHARDLAAAIANLSFDLENNGYDPRMLQGVVESLSSQECESVAGVLDQPVPTIEPTGDSLWLKESGQESIIQNGELYQLWEREFVRMVKERMQHESLPRPGPAERLRRIAELLAIGPARDEALYRAEIIQCVVALNISTAAGLHAHMGDILENTSNEFAREQLLEALLPNIETKLSRKEVLLFLKGESKHIIWKYFRSVWDGDARARMRAEEQAEFLEALFQIIPEWDTDCITDTRMDYQKRQDEARKYFFRLSAAYIEAYGVVHPRDGLVPPLKTLIRDGYLGFTKEPLLFLGNTDMHEEFRALTEQEVFELARFCTAETHPRKSIGHFIRPENFESEIAGRAVGIFNHSEPTERRFTLNPGRRSVKDNIAFAIAHVPPGVRDEFLNACLYYYENNPHDPADPVAMVESDKIWPGGAFALFQPLREKEGYWNKSEYDFIPGDAEVAKHYDPSKPSFTSVIEKKFSSYGNKIRVLERYLTQIEFWKNDSLTPTQKLQRIIELVPERTDYRDHLFQKIEAAAIAQFHFTTQGHALIPAEGHDGNKEAAQYLYDFYTHAIPLMVEMGVQQLWSRRADELYRAALQEGEPSFSSEIKRIKQLYPQASFVRDEALMRLGDSGLVQTPEQSRAVLAELFEVQRRTPDKRELAEQSYLEMINGFVAHLSQSERKDFVLWSIGAVHEPPKTLRAIGAKGGFSVAEIPNLIFGATPQEREEFFIRLLYGQNGVMDPHEQKDEAMFAEFLGYSFDRIFPQDAKGLDTKGRQILKTIYTTVLQTYEPFRRAKIFISMMEVMRGQGKESLIGERIRGLLENLGPVFIKAGQLASEEERAPGVPFLPEDIRREVLKLKQEAKTFHRTAAFQVCEAVGEFARSDANQNPLVTLDERIGAASIKQVYTARESDGKTVVEKVRRPSIGKHLEEDLRVLARVMEELGKINDVPEGLAERIGRWVRDEADFDQEVRYHEDAEATFRDYANDRAVSVLPVRVADIYTHSPEHIREEYMRGLTLGDLMDVRDGRTTLAELGNERGLSPAEAAGYSEWVTRLDDVRLQAFDALTYQIFRKGKFHADPHAGNIVITPEREMAFIDMGSSGEVGEEQIGALRKFFGGFLSRDGGLVRESIREFVPAADEIMLMDVMFSIEDGALENREKFKRILISISKGGRAIDEGFEKFLKALGTGAYLTREIAQEKLLPSIFAHTRA